MVASGRAVVFRPTIAGRVRQNKGASGKRVVCWAMRETKGKHGWDKSKRKGLMSVERRFT